MLCAISQEELLLALLITLSEARKLFVQVFQTLLQSVQHST